MPGQLFIDAVDHLQLIDEESRDTIRELVRGVPVEHGVRAVWVKPYEERIRQEGEAIYKAYMRLAMRFPDVKLFQHTPTAQFFLMSLQAGELLFPDEGSLVERTNRYMRVAVGAFMDSFAMQAMLKACEGDVHVFLTLISDSDDIFFNHGSSSYERVDEHSAVMYHSKRNSALWRYLMPGFCEGAYSRFGVQATASFEELGEDAFEIHFAL